MLLGYLVSLGFSICVGLTFGHLQSSNITLTWVARILKVSDLKTAIREEMLTV
jgi:hypothetical protein